MYNNTLHTPKYTAHSVDEDDGTSDRIFGRCFGGRVIWVRVIGSSEPGDDHTEEGGSPSSEPGDDHTEEGVYVFGDEGRGVQLWEVGRGGGK